MGFEMKNELLGSLLFLTAIAAPAADVSYSKKFGDWTAVVTADAMTDEKRCLATYALDPHVWYTDKDAIKIDYKARGGVQSFQYRFGKSQASEVQAASDDGKDRATIPVFVAEVLDMPYARVRGTTVLNTVISLDISFKGLKAARAALAERCEMEALPSVNSDAPEWSKWQVRQPQ